MLFQWGRCGDDWVLLEPVETHDDLDKSYLDENGAPRADHRDRHDGVPAVNVTRLARKIKADIVPDDQTETNPGDDYVAHQRPDGLYEPVQRSLLSKLRGK
jgi:hypothetical protein